MKQRISTMIAVIFLIFAVVSAQQRNGHYSSRIDDSLAASDARSSRTHRQTITYQRGRLYGLRNHRSSTAHFVNGSNTNDAYVKVYGEANPSKTDEHLLDIETQTQLLPVRGRISSSGSSGGDIHELSLSGYGPPGGEPEAPEVAGADEQAEAAKEMQAPLRPDVENPYDSIPAATEAEQQAITAEISSTSSAKEESALPSVTDTEQAIISSEATASAIESEEGLRETEEGRTESDLSATEYGMGREISTEGSMAIETVSSSGISTEQFESKSIATEAVGISTSEGVKIEDESRFGKYGAGDESARTEAIPETEVQGTPSAGIEFTPSESATETSISDVITQTEPVKLETGAEDLGYGVPPETPEEQPSAEETPSSISQTMPEGEATMTSGTEETAYSDTTLIAIELLTSPATSSPSSHIITEGAEIISSPVVESAEDVPGYETLSEPEVSETGLPELGTESTSQLAKSTEEAATAEETEIISEKAPEDMVTEPEDLKDSTGLVTPSAEVSETTEFLKEASLPPVEQLPGYGEVAPEYTTGHTEATELQKISEGTETPAETGPAEEKAVSDETPAISETTEFLKEASLPPVEQLPGYGEVAPEYATGHTEATELQKVSEETEAYAETGPTEGKTEFMKTEAGPSEQLSSTEILTESGITATEILERTTQPSEWETKTNELSSMLAEISPSESSVVETKFDSATTAFNEQVITEETVASAETKGFDEQPLGYGEPLVVPDSSHESSKEAILKATEETTKFAVDEGPTTTEGILSSETERIESSLPEKTSDGSIGGTTAPLTSSQYLSTSETIITTGKAEEETESASTIQIEHTETRIGAEDFGYGGGGEAVTEKEHIDETSVVDTAVPKSDLESTTLSEEVLIPSTAAGAEETTESPDVSTELRESTEGITESTEQFTSGGAETSEKVSGYDIPATETIMNELPPSDEKLAIPQETGESTPEISEIASATEGTASLTSERAESVVTGHAIPEGTEYAEMPVSETASVQIESSKIPTDTHDFGYGEKLEEVTEAQLTVETQDSGTSIAVTEPMLTTQEEIITETMAESTQQPSATETLSAESSIMISSETIDSSTESKTSLQYPEEATLLQTSPELPKSDAEDTATPLSTEGSETVETSVPAESTLMHVVTSEVEVQSPYGEEAPQVIAMTKIMKTGPSIITAGITTSGTLTTEGAKEEVEGTGIETTEKSSLETMKEIEAETIESEEPTEVRSEMDTISSETALITSPEELIRATAGITETESYEKSNGDVSARIPMGPADFGYGGEIEHSSSILPGIESAKTTIPVLPLSSEQYTNKEASAIPESIVTAEYSSTGMFSESESKSSKEYASATFSSVASEALTESVTQMMSTKHEESITSEDIIHDQKGVLSKIPTGPADFGYGDAVQEQGNEASNPRAFSDAIIAPNKRIIFENQGRTRQKNFDGPLVVVSNTVSASKPLEKIDNSSRRKWKPFTIDCKKEVDEKGELCQEWARAGLCATHRPTMFLFCRRTCLCIGPPMDLIR